MFDREIAKYRKGDRRVRHFILTKWAVFGFLAVLAGFCLEIELDWRIGGVVALIGVFGVIVLTVTALADLTSGKKSLAYISENPGTRRSLTMRWGFISFAVALVGGFMALFHSLHGEIGSVVSLIGIVVFNLLIMTGWKEWMDLRRPPWDDT
jgi:uncharacterized membrane protein